MSVSYDFTGDAPTSTPSQSSSPPPTDLNAQLLQRPSFIEQLGLQFGLNEEQVSVLHGLHHLRSLLPGNLSPADLMTRVYTLACQYSVEQRLLFALRQPSVTTGTSGNADLKGVVDELAIRLDKSFQLGKDQKANIRQLCQEQIYKPTRTAFKDLHVDVLKKLRETPAKYDLQNVFGIGKPSREAQVASETRRIASGVRNIFRTDIHNGIIGEWQVSLKKFTTDCNERYRWGTTASGTTEQGYLVHNALLHHFAFENKELLVGQEEDTEVVEEEEHASKRARSGLPKNQGRKQAGTDFWSRVDRWFEEAKEEHGNDFSSDTWKVYIEESITTDDERYETFQDKDNSNSSTFTFTSTMPMPQVPSSTLWSQRASVSTPSQLGPNFTMPQPGGMSMQSLVHGYVTSQRSF